MLTVLFRGTFGVAAGLLVSVGACAQQSTFQPQVGQAGRDVVWVPTPDEVVDRMLRMAQTTANDYVIDLGAGDGKIVIAAARRFGARALGVEYNPDMVKHAAGNIERAGVQGRARVMQGDIFATDFSQATVLTLYLLPGLNLKLRPTILNMRPGTRIVSHSFTMDDWEPDETSSIDGRRALLWFVPANVMGGWNLEMTGAGAAERFEISIEQKYQVISGTVQLAPREQGGLRDARLRGAQIGFAFVDNNGTLRTLTGRAVGANRMEGSFRTDAGAEGRWLATKR